MNYRCPFPNCDFSSWDPRELAKHHDKVHRLEKYVCPCDDCDYEVDNLGSFHGHLLSKHQMGKQERIILVMEMEGKPHSGPLMFNLQSSRSHVHSTEEEELVE